jgi:hypothetical protein
MACAGLRLLSSLSRGAKLHAGRFSASKVCATELPGQCTSSNRDVLDLGCAPVTSMPTDARRLTPPRPTPAGGRPRHVHADRRPPTDAAPTDAPAVSCGSTGFEKAELREPAPRPGECRTLAGIEFAQPRHNPGAGALGLLL